MAGLEFLIVIAIILILNAIRDNGPRANDGRLWADIDADARIRARLAKSDAKQATKAAWRQKPLAVRASYRPWSMIAAYFGGIGLLYAGFMYAVLPSALAPIMVLALPGFFFMMWWIGGKS